MVVVDGEHRKKELSSKTISKVESRGFANNIKYKNISGTWACINVLD
jgi:hypothetical protein